MSMKQEKVQKETEEVNKNNEEAPSTEILLATTEDIPSTLLAELAEYIKVRLAKINKVLSPSAPSLNNENDDDSNRPVQDSHDQVLNNVDKMAQLTKLKGLLKDFYTQLTINGIQDRAKQPSVINHIIETFLTDRL